MEKVVDPKAPYTVQARLHEGDVEHRLGAANTVEEAEALAEAAVDTGPYAIAHVYDRDGRHDRTARRQRGASAPLASDGREEAM